MPLLRHIHCATTLVRPSPSQEVKPSQGIVWPRSLFTTQIASTIPSLGSREAPGQNAEKLREGLVSRTSSKSPLASWCRKGRENPGLCLGGFLRGQRLLLSRCRREVAICAGRSVLKKPYQRGASAGPGLRAGSECQVRPSVPNPGAPATKHTGPGLRPVSRPTAEDLGTRARAPAASCPPPPYLWGPGRGR